MKVKIKNLKIPSIKEVGLYMEYRLMGIEETGNFKEVVAEKSYCWNPTENEIAQFLYENPKADFCVIQKRYSIGDE